MLEKCVAVCLHVAASQSLSNSVDKTPLFTYGNTTTHNHLSDRCISIHTASIHTHTQTEPLARSQSEIPSIRSLCAHSESGICICDHIDLCEWDMRCRGEGGSSGLHRRRYPTTTRGISYLFTCVSRVTRGEFACPSIIKGY